MTKDTEKIESMPIHVRDEFLEILMSSNAARGSTKGMQPTKKQTKMIKAIEKRMNRLFEDKLHSEDAKPDDALALARSYIHISQIYSDSIAKETLAEAYLLRVSGLLEGRETTRQAILTAMKAHNCLGHIYLKQKNIKRSLLFHEKALMFYWTYTNDKDSYPAPVDILRAFGIVTKEFDSEYSLDQQYMSTLFALINLHISINAELNKSTIVIYEHMLLEKQVRFIPLTIDRAEWALRAAMISEYLSSHDRFTEARNHLGIAFYMLNKFYRSEYKNIDGTNFPEIKVALYKHYSNVAVFINMYAAQYGIDLLRSSTERILRFEKKDEQSKTKPESLVMFEQKLPDMLMFTSTSNVEEEFDTWITDEYLVNYDDAKTVFTIVLRCFNEVLAYNNPITTKYTQAKILRKTSEACKYLACYEQNENKQILLYIWQIHILENSKQLFNTDFNINFRRLVLLEQAITRVTILDMYMDGMGLDVYQKPDISSVINHHVQHALSTFQAYLYLRK